MSEYNKYHVQQLNGSDNAGYNCAAASLAIQIRLLTDNKLKPGPEQLRNLIHDAVDRAGLTGSQVKEAYWDYLKPRWQTKWGKIPPFRLHQNDEWADFIAMLDKGYSAHTQLQYSEVPSPYRRKLSTFQGPHAVLTIKRATNKHGVAGFLVADPLKGQPIFWPEKVMKDAAFTRSGNGYIDAAYVPRLFGADKPEPPVVEEPPTDPTDEIPVPPTPAEEDELLRLKNKVIELTEDNKTLEADIDSLESMNATLREDAFLVRDMAQAIVDREVP